MLQHQKNKMDVTEEIFETFNIDKKKRVNRSDKTISESTVDTVKQKGITSEMLNKLDVPVFKYKTQVTIHGDWDRLDNELFTIGGYKWLFINKNGSLGVKYNAIDFDKKKRIYNSLRHVGWNIRKSSNELYAYKTAKVAGNREEALQNGKDLIKRAKEIKTDYFIGGVQANLLHARFIGYVVELRLTVNSIFEEDVDRLIEDASGKTIEEIEQIKEEKKRQKEKERKEREAKWDRKEKQAQKLYEKLSNKLDDDNRLTKLDRVLEDGYFLSLKISKFGNNEYPYEVIHLFKKGRQKLFRKSTKTFKTIDEAIAYMKEGKEHKYAHEKQRNEMKNVYTLSS